jgi:putative flippase GtrA
VSQSLLDLARQFTRFTGTGFISAIGHYGLLISLVQGFGVEPVRASLAGALLGAWINYAVNYRYTFRSHTRHRESVPKFAVVAGIGLLLNTGFMWLGVHVLAAHYLLSQMLATVLVLLWSFGANRYWTFRVP